MRPGPERRGAYVRFERVQTRWADNDAYRHVNNLVYYSYFDTVINQILIEAGVLDIEASPVIGLAVETGCRYFSSVAYPDVVWAGLRVGHLGTSSVRYEVAVFRGEAAEASAQGHMVHVYVDRATQRPVALPGALRALLEPLRRG